MYAIDFTEKKNVKKRDAASLESTCNNSSERFKEGLIKYTARKNIDPTMITIIDTSVIRVDSSRPRLKLLVFGNPRSQAITSWNPYKIQVVVGAVIHK